MPNINEIIANRQSQIENDDDFSVGTIAGLEDISSTTTNQNQTNQGVVNMTTVATEQETNVATHTVTPEELEGTVELKIVKRYTDLVTAITSRNTGCIVQDFGGYFQVNAPSIKITRQDAESALGGLNDAQWRMLFMNREGDTVTFNNYEFVMGNVEQVIEERKELAQINIRIDKNAKDTMDEVKNLLGMTQAEFLEVAIKELADKILVDKI